MADGWLAAVLVGRCIGLLLMADGCYLWMGDNDLGLDEISSTTITVYAFTKAYNVQKSLSQVINIWSGRQKQQHNNMLSPPNLIEQTNSLRGRFTHI
jgi:hypothetical protein